MLKRVASSPPNYRHRARSARPTVFFHFTCAIFGNAARFPRVFPSSPARIAAMSSVIMQVYKVGDVVNGILTLLDDPDLYIGEIVGILLNPKGVANPQPDSAWTLEITIKKEFAGDPKNVRPPLRLQLAPFISVSDSLQEPLFLPDRQLVFYRNQLFIADSPPKTANERSEIIAEVEKRVRGETSEPTEPMPRPPGVPKGYARLWVH